MAFITKKLYLSCTKRTIHMNKPLTPVFSASLGRGRGSKIRLTGHFGWCKI